jgi:excinuclease UvrABC helicase subunit UvrB
MGRAARHLEGRAILYADRMTDSMKLAISETDRRRAKQEAYNRDNNITPMSIIKSVDMQLVRIIEADYMTVPVEDAALGDIKNEAQLISAIAQLEGQMRAAAKNFEFEKAASLRDKIRALKQRDMGEIFAPAENSSRNSETITEISGSPAGTGTVNSPGQEIGPAKPRGASAKASKKS